MIIEGDRFVVLKVFSCVIRGVRDFELRRSTVCASCTQKQLRRNSNVGGEGEEGCYMFSIRESVRRRATTVAVVNSAPE